MPRCAIVFLLLLGFAGCQAQAQVLPTVSAAPTAVAPPSQTPPPAATTLPATPRLVNALPIRRILFQPGDLPDGYRIGRVSREIDEFVRYKLRAADVDAFVHLGLQQTANPSGGLAAYFYDDPGKIRGLYLQLIEWASHDGRLRVPEPNLGDEATLFLANYDQAPFTLIFRRCRAAVQIDLSPPARDDRIILRYAERIVQRLDAVDCQGASSVPVLTPLPPLPSLTPSPRVAIGQTIQAQVQRLIDPDGTDIIRAYSFADANHGWLALGVQILETRDGGTTWQPRFAVNSSVQDIHFVSIQVSWIEMKGGYLVTHDGGATWQREASKPEDNRMPPPIVPGPVDEDAYTFCPDKTPWAGPFFALDNETAWAFCVSSASAHYLDGGVRFFGTTDGGKHWQEFVGNAPFGQFGGTEIFFLDRRHGWIMTDDGLSASDDGGHNWRTITEGDYAGPANSQLKFISMKEGFKVAFPDDVLLRTDDGGVTWRKVFQAPPDPWPAGPTQFFADGTGVGASDGSTFQPDGSGTAAILQSTDAGRSWTRIGSFEGLCASDQLVRVSAMSFPDRQHGWAALDCGPQPQPLYRTSDGGKTWQALPSSGMLGGRPVGVSFVDQQTGYLVTEAGRLFRTIDAGTTFAPVDNLAVHTPSLRFATKDVGWELRGTQLFETRDGGNSWQLLDLGYQMQEFSLLPNGQAWVVIGGRASAEKPNPARRFLVLQPDGQTWIEYQLGKIPSNWRDPELDSIQFADPLNGWLRADTALYYTADSGRSWTQFH